MTEVTDLDVVVVGAGFGGIGLGVELLRVGITRFLILEKASELGGVWRDNTYPGCACDVPSHLYSFSFAPYTDSTIRYPDRRDIQEYLRSTAIKCGLQRHLRLNTPVTAASFGEDGRWLVTTSTGDRYTAGSLVWTVGQLHRPHIPALAGRELFQGRAFHSARWDHTVSITGRNIAVIGTGSSAAQMVPHLARDAAKVTVFQRTPAWVLPKPARRFGPVARWVLEHIPAMHAIYRKAIYYGADLVLSPVMTAGWTAHPARWVARAHLRLSVPDPQLRARLTPRYRIGEKRIVLDNDFYRALCRPNVELVTEPITELTSSGLRCADSRLHPADVIVFATGFRASEFLAPIEVRGRDGVLLSQQWAKGASAFYGLAVPGFPSMWMLAGPNSFSASGSNPTIKEFQARYVVRGIQQSMRLGAAIEVSPSAMHSYQQWMDDAMAGTIWPTGVDSWYKTASGKVTNPWPATNRAFDRMTKHHPATDFEPVTAADTSCTGAA
ncbi:flavin-containing monooxygenase [Nocardia suismassiliense]|uniref:flavin-containing monooxygenase n=1 Tax=Nocardia suismassiliense TaxID=2077092 RepID=UPI00131ED1E5|nr:NAD(P)/FAD-dependent oxidoreductase [Nocardia suismassiliense]